jgi:hypothetical protein
MKHLEIIVFAVFEEAGFHGQPHFTSLAAVRFLSRRVNFTLLILI